MTTIHQEILQNSAQETQENEKCSIEENSCEMTKEIFRRDLAPPNDDTPNSQLSSPTKESFTKSQSKTPVSKKQAATTKKSNSGIPLRLKSATNTVKSPTRGGTYRHAPSTPMNHVINKNTLEVQFMNNRKRLLQLHAELVEKQRPLQEMHKSLLRTKKQLEEMGKKVVLEDLKVMSLKTDDQKPPLQMDGAGENYAAEAASDLKKGIENALEECLKVCKKCFVERDHVVELLESASKSGIEASNIEVEIEELKKEKNELEKTIENAIKENEKKMEDVIENWEKVAKMKSVSNEAAMKIADMEETIKRQQKIIQESDDNLHSLNRKFEDKKATFEKTINEMQEKYNKLEEELKKEKKNANENLMKSRNLRNKATELEVKSKEAEEKYIEMSNKLKQVQEQMRKKEIQWVKEREEFKKNEALLQQKFTEKQSQFDTRLKDMELLQKNTELHSENKFRNLETQLEIREQEFAALEKNRNELAEKCNNLEKEIQSMKKHLEAKDKEIMELKNKVEDIPVLELKESENHWIEMMETKQKLSESESNIEHLKEQINKMQSSLKSHAKLAAAVKLEKDKAIEYSNKLREVLQEARNEIQEKTKIIYKIHEKLVLKDKENEKLKLRMKELENYDLAGDKWYKNRCQICLTAMGEEKGDAMSSLETEVGKCNISPPQYVSESLIGMSVKKVDKLRARLDNLKRMNLPIKTKINAKCSNESQPINNHLKKQIEMRGKLYQILQKHADQSCEDFINLLKLTVSKGAQSNDELKPSNIKDIDETIKQFKSSQFRLTESSFSQYIDTPPINDSTNSDTEDYIY